MFSVGAHIQLKQQILQRIQRLQTIRSLVKAFQCWRSQYYYLSSKLSAVLLQIHSGTFLVREIWRISLTRTSFIQFNLRRGHTSSKTMRTPRRPWAKVEPVQMRWTLLKPPVHQVCKEQRFISPCARLKALMRLQQQQPSHCHNQAAEDEMPTLHQSLQ